MKTPNYSDLCNIVQPIILVLTPSLSHGCFLWQTIESVTCQTFRSFEHIVIDGGSTDEAIGILKQCPHV
jgi:glycosyltransferase involved in cell wall biosynthesis